MRVIGLLALLFLGMDAQATTTCVCVTRVTPQGRDCALTTGHYQGALARRALGANESCTLPMCQQIHEGHSNAQGHWKERFTCDRFVVDPDTVGDIVECTAQKPTMFHLSLTQDFDRDRSTEVPRSYQPLRLDVIRCDTSTVVRTIEAYVDALSGKGCGCKNLVVNFNSHGTVENELHKTECKSVDTDGKRSTKLLSSRDLATGIMAVLAKKKCEAPLLVFDSCFSGKVIEDLRGVPVTTPILVSTEKTCLAPGDSNLWSKYKEWCSRCDRNVDRMLTLEEIRDCLPSTPHTVTFIPRASRHIIQAEGPFGLTHADGMPGGTTIFQCELPLPPPRRSGLQLRDWGDKAPLLHDAP